MTVQIFFKIVIAPLMVMITAISGMFGGAAPKDICMIAHRGYSGVYPENTELAFEKAAEHGSGGAETDVRITKDGVFVLSHNSEVVLKDGTELKVSEHTYEELTAQPLKNKKTRDEVYLCTFERYLEVMKKHDMVCFIELKGEYTDEQVAEVFTIAQNTYDLSKCILQSFNFDNLLKARELFPDLPLMLTYSVDDGDYTKCFEYGISIDANYVGVTKEMVQEFHDRGLQFAVWTANEFFSLSYCKTLGVDYIESDVF